MALRLAHIEPREYSYICTPPGDEMPGMNEHWKRLEDMLQSPLLRLPEMTRAQYIRREITPPNFQARFCAHHLIIIPFERWMLKNLPCLGCIGPRADENREGVKRLIKTQPGEAGTRRWMKRGADWGRERA